MGQRGPKKGAENAGRPAGTRRAIGRLKGPTRKEPAAAKAATKPVATAVAAAGDPPPVTMTIRDLQRLKFPELVRSITEVRGHPPHIGIVTLLYHSLQQYFEFEAMYQRLLKNAKANAAHEGDSDWQRLPELYNLTDKSYVVEHPVVARKVKQADQCTKLLKECMVTPWVQARLVPDVRPVDAVSTEGNTGPTTDDLQEDWDAGMQLPMTPPDDVESSDPANKTRRRKVSGQRAQRAKTGRNAGATGDRTASAGPE